MSEPNDLRYALHNLLVLCDSNSSDGLAWDAAISKARSALGDACIRIQSDIDDYACAIHREQWPCKGRTKAHDEAEREK